MFFSADLPTPRYVTDAESGLIHTFIFRYEDLFMLMVFFAMGPLHAFTTSLSLSHSISRRLCFARQPRPFSRLLSPLSIEE